MRLAAALAVVVSAAAARAEVPPMSTGVAADRFAPGVGPAALLVGEGAEVTGPAQVSWALSLSYQRDPLKLAQQFGGQVVSRPVRDQLTLDLALETGLWKRLALAVGVPVVLWQAGDRLAVAGDPRPLDYPVGGDLRMRLKVAALGDPRRDGLHLALQLQVTVPLSKDDFAATGTVTVEPRLTADFRFGPVLALAQLGARFAGERELFFTRFGDELTWLAGTHVRLGSRGRFVGAALAEVGGFVGPSPGTRPIEVRGGFRFGVAPWSLDLAAGAGVVNEAGAPAFRVLAILRHAFGIL